MPKQTQYEPNQTQLNPISKADSTFKEKEMKDTVVTAQSQKI